MGEGQANAEPIQILSSTPNNVTLVNEEQLAHEQPTCHVASVGDEASDDEEEEVFDETTCFISSKSGGEIRMKSLHKR